MSRILVGAFIASLTTGAALAADLPAVPNVYRPRVIGTVSPRDWTGFYLGGNVGYGWSPSPADVTFNFATGSSSGDISGVIGGGQIGYNRQFGMAVLGLELDGQGSGQSRNSAIPCGAGCTINESAKIKEFGTVRARLGVAADWFLGYVTAGGAYLHLTDDLVATAGGPSANVLRINAGRVGWTAGAGVELAVTGNWTVKLEYLYLSSALITVAGPIPVPLGGRIVTESIEVRDNIVRVGFNYRFSPSGPVAMQY